MTNYKSLREAFSTLLAYILMVSGLAFVWIEACGSLTGTSAFRYVGF